MSTGLDWLTHMNDHFWRLDNEQIWDIVSLIIAWHIEIVDTSIYIALVGLRWGICYLDQIWKAYNPYNP